MKSYETITCSVENHIATVTLNRPDMLNAFNIQMRVDLLDAVQALDDNEAVRVVILTGSGKAFSAGADLVEKQSADFCVERQLQEEYKPILLAISASPKVYICAVNGAAAGAGSAFAMIGDLCLMADNAYIYQAFAAIGLVPDCGASWHLTRQLGPKLACELILCGDKLKADRCVELGLANRVVPAEKLLDEAAALAATLVKKAPLAVRYSKQLVNNVGDMNLSDAMSLEAKLQKIALDSHDFLEGQKAFFEKRAPQFIGS